MSELLQFQRDFARAIAGPVDGALAVYRNTVLRGSVEALQANFPVVEQILGSEMFERVAVDFAEECPPIRPVLALYGARFPPWLETRPWTADLPYLPDVARIERLRIESLMAADAPPATHCAAGLRLHPATRFAWLESPAKTIWIAHQGEFPDALELDWRPEGIVFTRPGPTAPAALPLGAAGYHLLAGIQRGECLADVLAAALAEESDSEPQRLLDVLIDAGAFVAITSGGTRA